jgi:outer membrane lipoprotein SlyB
MMDYLKKLTLLSSLIMLAACAGPNPYGHSTDRYSQGEANQSMQVRYGTIVDLQPVSLNSENNTVGTVAGGLLGGIAGSGVGRGKGRAAATVAGAVLGGYLGNKAQGAMGANGVQITLQMRNGETMSVVQEVNPNVLFRRGDEVQVLGGQYGKTRVVR